MGEAHGDARRLVELGDRPVGHRHQRGAEQGDVLDAARIGADRVEPLGVGLHAGGGEVAVARLVADDAAEGAGRITEPPVCVPVASTTWKSATAAAEPDEEPPGVCAGLCGFFVRPGWRLANSVVTVLPSRIAPSALRQGDGGGVGQRLVRLVDRRAVGRRLVAGIDDVLHAHRDAVQQALAWSAIEQSGAFEGSIARQMRPGEHLGVALVDAFEMGAHDRLGGHRPGIDPLREFGGGERVRCGHGRRWNSKIHAASTAAGAFHASCERNVRRFRMLSRRRRSSSRPPRCPSSLPPSPAAPRRNSSRRCASP